MTSKRKAPTSRRVGTTRLGHDFVSRCKSELKLWLREECKRLEANDRLWRLLMTEDRPSTLFVKAASSTSRKRRSKPSHHCKKDLLRLKSNE